MLPYCLRRIVDDAQTAADVLSVQSESTLKVAVVASYSHGILCNADFDLSTLVKRGLKLDISQSESGRLQIRVIDLDD